MKNKTLAVALLTPRPPSPCRPLADETCNSPYMATSSRARKTSSTSGRSGVKGLGDGQDKLVTIDANPKSKNYGKVVSQRLGRRRAAKRTTWASPTTAATSGPAASTTARSTCSTSAPIRRSRSS